MSNIIVTNIPEKFTIEQLFGLLEQSNIPCTNRNVKIVKSNRIYREASSGRYCILGFDTDIIATTAIQAINQIVLTVNQQEVFIRAMPFISNFKQLSYDSTRNIVIYNLPKELGNQDLTEIFQDFGKVLSAVVKKSTDDKPNMGYVLFDQPEEAKRAIAEADGKYLGPNKIQIKQFRSIEDRMLNNPEVLLLSAGQQEMFQQESAKRRLMELCPQVEFAPNSDIFIKNDSRPDNLNSKGAAWIFTAASPEIAKRFIDVINEKNYQFEGVKDSCRAVPKLSKGMLAKQKAQKQVENRKKYSDSGASIYVYGLRNTCTSDEVKAFFSKYGEIAEISKPNSSLEVQADLFHFNILYTKPAEAEAAITNAAQDELHLGDRLADNDKLKVSKYTSKSEVKSTAKRQTDKKQQQVEPM